MGKRNVSLRRFFRLPNLMSDMRKNENNYFGGYIFLCQPPYNSNFRYSEANISSLKDFKFKRFDSRSTISTTRLDYVLVPIVDNV